MEDVLSTEAERTGGKFPAAGQVVGRVKTQGVSSGFPGVHQRARRHRQRPFRRLRTVQRRILRLKGKRLPALQVGIPIGDQIAGGNG